LLLILELDGLNSEGKSKAAGEGARPTPPRLRHPEWPSGHEGSSADRHGRGVHIRSALAPSQAQDDAIVRGKRLKLAHHSIITKYSVNSNDK
jgi:hypothetical protein